MIEFKNVSYRYKQSKILKNISLSIEDGEFVFVVGKSGAGKTTFIKLLMREIVPDTGEIIVNGKNVAAMKRRELPYYRREIGVIFQDFKLLNDRSIYENIAFPMRVIGRSVRSIRSRASELLTYVGLAERYRALPLELSGGERQRVAIARSLVNRPLLLLADEPTGNLDPDNSLNIMKLLETINKDGTTVVVVTHNQDLVNTLKKRVIRIDDGRITDDRKEGVY